ncbi:hypothetical protein EBZ57_01740 [bacterium]|jgi:hypothetical protein|nr:hypothetical protein [bacterium]
MNPAIILGAIILLPVIILMLGRISASLVFLSLCLGNVLVQYVGPESSNFVNLLTPQVQGIVNPTDNNIRLFLLLTPVVLTSIFMIKSVHGSLKMILNILPAAGVGLLGALLVVPLLPSGISSDILNSDIYSQIKKAQIIIVGGSAVVCLLFLWMQRPKGGHGKHKKH